MCSSQIFVIVVLWLEEIAGKGRGGEEDEKGIAR